MNSLLLSFYYPEKLEEDDEVDHHCLSLFNAHVQLLIALALSLSVPRPGVPLHSLDVHGETKGGFQHGLDRDSREHDFFKNRFIFWSWSFLHDSWFGTFGG